MIKVNDVFSVEKANVISANELLLGVPASIFHNIIILNGGKKKMIDLTPEEYERVKQQLVGKRGK